jgi:hypothetical protein
LLLFLLRQKGFFCSNPPQPPPPPSGGPRQNTLDEDQEWQRNSNQVYAGAKSKRKRVVFGHQTVKGRVA